MQKSSPKYHPRFLELYAIAQEFSIDHNVKFNEAIESALGFYNCKYSQEKILDELRRIHRYSPSLAKYSQKVKDNRNVWLIYGESGQGKSSFINTLCESMVADESEGIVPESKEVELFFSDDLLLIETPGVLDSRLTKNEDISESIIYKVQESLGQEAKIDAIFFLWCPNFSMKLRLDVLLTNITRALGKDSLKSVIFLINKVTSEWSTTYDKAVHEFSQELKTKTLNNPIYICDVKDWRRGNIEDLNDLTRKVQPFRESTFEAYKMGHYYEKFLKFQRAAEKEEEERQRAQREREKEEQDLQRRFETIRKEAERRRQEELRRLEEVRQLELRRIEEEERRKLRENEVRIKELENKINKQTTFKKSKHKFNFGLAIDEADFRYRMGLSDYDPLPEMECILPDGHYGICRHKYYPN